MSEEVVSSPPPPWRKVLESFREEFEIGGLLISSRAVFVRSLPLLQHLLRRHHSRRLGPPVPACDTGGESPMQNREAEEGHQQQWLPGDEPQEVRGSEALQVREPCRPMQVHIPRREGPAQVPFPAAAAHLRHGAVQRGKESGGV